jgi:uncharacterized membrane protein YgcG
MRVGTERHLVCIEDPFDTSHDLGRTVGPNGADRLRGEFRLAWRVLRDAPDAVERLFAPVPEDRALWDGEERGSGGGGGSGGGRGSSGGGARGGGRGGRR